MQQGLHLVPCASDRATRPAAREAATTRTTGRTRRACGTGTAAPQRGQELIFVAASCTITTKGGRGAERGRGVAPHPPFCSNSHRPKENDRRRDAKPLCGESGRVSDSLRAEWTTLRLRVRVPQHPSLCQRDFSLTLSLSRSFYLGLFLSVCASARVFRTLSPWRPQHLLLLAVRLLCLRIAPRRACVLGGRCRGSNRKRPRPGRPGRAYNAQELGPAGWPCPRGS